MTTFHGTFPVLKMHPFMRIPLLLWGENVRYSAESRQNISFRWMLVLNHFSTHNEYAVALIQLRQSTCSSISHSNCDMQFALNSQFYSCFDSENWRHRSAKLELVNWPTTFCQELIIIIIIKYNNLLRIIWIYCDGMYYVCWKRFAMQWMEDGSANHV